MGIAVRDIYAPMKTLGSRIKHFRQAKGWSQAKLAEACGWASQSRVGNYEVDKREPSMDDLRLIAEKLGIGLYELLGETVPADGVSEGPSVAGQIPIISYVQAGEFCEAEDPFEPGMADEWLPFRPPGAGPRTYALRVDGESNTPRIRNGEIVIVDPDRAPDSGKFVVAKRHSDEKVTLKQIQYNEGEPFLKPGNPDWPEPIIKIDGGWSICGVVIGKYDPM